MSYVSRFFQLLTGLALEMGPFRLSLMALFVAWRDLNGF
jgi:hypothetical protein